MNVFRKLLFGVIVGASLTAIAPSTVKADDYWDGYWSWYDNSYQPYYYRQYRNPGGYSGYYDNSYYGNPYYGRGYYYPNSRYYGTRDYGYQDYGAGRGSVQVGPLRFGWR